MTCEKTSGECTLRRGFPFLAKSEEETSYTNRCRIKPAIQAALNHTKVPLVAFSGVCAMRDRSDYVLYLPVQPHVRRSSCRDDRSSIFRYRNIARPAVSVCQTIFLIEILGDEVILK